jgi:hypothetical protein
VQQLTGDGHAGFVQFGDAVLEQRLSVSFSRSSASSPASTSVSITCRTWTAAPRAGQRRGERAHLAWSRPDASTIESPGGAGGVRSGSGCAVTPAAVGHSASRYAHNTPMPIAVGGAKVERRLDADVFAELAGDEGRRRAAEAHEAVGEDAIGRGTGADSIRPASSACS